MFEKAHSKDYYNRRKSALELERSSFMPHWRELSEFVRPRRGRFFISDRNRGIKKHQSIINSKATKALQIATAGMLAGTISPSRPWFLLETYDQDLMKIGEVQDWLYQSELILRTILNESNFYGMASQSLNEVLLFGTSLMTHIDDFEDVARFYNHTTGSYAIGLNDRFEVDTVFREFDWTAGQMAKAFGIENLSTTARNAIDKGNYDAWFPVCHIIEPNESFYPKSPKASNKPFKSVYYEPSTQGADKDKWLRVSGFDEFPAYAFRWDVTGEDIYGTDCPGMTALGDIKGLQIEEKRKAQAIDLMVRPLLTGPATLKNSPIQSLPGGLTLYDGDDQRQQLRPIYQIQPNLQELRLDMEAVERRIDEAFFVDMFMAISSMEGIQPRNQMDLIHRNEERLLQLGPVLERLHGEFLDKVIDRLFNQALKADILPPIPAALAAQPLRINYVSSLAMAQRAVATQSIDRVAAFAAGLLSAGFEQVREKVDAENALDEYSKAVGAPPSILVAADVLAERRAEQAQQVQEQQAMEQMQQGAQIAQTAAGAKTDERNLLTDVMNG